jgi:hypothetical protein
MSKKIFFYAVAIEAETQEQADQVMNERLDPDEDYGFEYKIENWNRY